MRRISLILLLLLSLNISAQIVSVEVHSDNSVTFRYKADDVVTARVKSDCLLNKKDNSWFGGKMRTKRMHRESTGTFTLTTKSLEPEVYQYRFIINGIYRHDPCNKDSAYVLLHQESIVVVGGNPQADLYLDRTDIPHGRIDTVSYYNATQELTRYILVYTPPAEAGGLCQQDSLPVLYLLHGISGDEVSWLELGRVRQILDNMIYEGLTQPMIVVMPDCNVKNKLMPKRRTNLLHNMLNYAALQRGDFEKAFPDMHRFISENYKISHNRQNRYIAGLSSGAKQAANIVRDNPSLFSVVGLFSPVLGKKQLPSEPDSAVFHIYVGKNDLFYKNGCRFNRRLEKANVAHTFYEHEGGHSWRNWKIFLTEMLKVLNNEE